MEVRRQKDPRHVDRRQIVSEPPRQEDVRYGTIFGTERFGHIGKGATEAVRREDHALADYYDSRDSGAPVGPFHQPAHSRYAIQDSMENHASVWTTLTATSAP